VLPLGEALNRLQRGKLPARSVVLTFDDGGYNFYAGAMPLLEEFGYPATVYMTTYHCVHQRPILRLTLRYLLWRVRQRVLAPGVLPGQGQTTDLRDVRQREHLAATLYNKARTLSDDREAQQAWVERIARQLGVDWDRFLESRLFHLMTEAEVADIGRRGIDVQLHTHRHRTPREKAAFQNEVLENRRIIERLTGRPARHFCYPSGDVDSAFLPWLHELGIVSATTCSVNLAKGKHDRLMLPRYVDTMLQSQVLFQSWLSGAGQILSPRGVFLYKNTMPSNPAD
jgi:peptidoglycan/xylan/chitin deacetylase (PgdA/CDA1 family)